MKRVLCLALLMALSVACSKFSDQSPQGRYDRAMELIDRLQFVEAESTLVQLQRADSVSPLADQGLALTYERKLWWLDALAHYSRLLDRQPNMTMAVAGSVRCYYNLGSYYDAARAAARWVVLDPVGYESYYWQALALIKTMDFAGASQALQKAEANGLDKAAVRLIEARIQWLRNAYDASVATAAQGTSARSSAAEYYVALADYYSERGIPDSAALAARQGYDKKADPFTARQCLDICCRHQRFWAARQLLKDWAARDKEQSVSLILHSRYLLAADDKSLLTVLPDQLLLVSPTAFTTLMYSALAYRSLYNELVSSSFLDQATTMNIAGLPDTFQTYMGAYAGYSYAQSLNRDAAARQLKEIKGWRTQTREYQSIVYSQMTVGGGTPEAEKMLDSLLPTYGKDPVWLTAIGDAYASAKGVKFGMGRRFYRMALDEAPSYRPAYVNLLRLAAVKGEYREAINVIDSFKQIGPITPELTFLHAQALVGVGRIDEGIAVFKQTFTLFPNDISTARGVYLALADKRQADKVRDLAQFLVATSRDNPDAHELAARALNDFGFAEEAIQTARQGLQLEADNLRLRAQEARGLHATGQSNQAKQIFDDNLAKDRSQGETVMYYSLMLAESGIDGKTAELLAMRALVVAPPDLFPAKNLARVYLILGQYTNSRQAGLRAVMIAPEDPDVWYMMGICQFHESLPEARESLQKAISLGLSGEYLTKAQEALRQL